ncbi:gas vesicle protein [Streptomyces solincola]|uniref:Gas vesicle protein n=1 Tax=Streptomyces solincola TaxID=2100817 RepID=A0A2S9PRH3_9ACTN|nr:gas vesicle protein [Streptomyces solincola]
MSAPVPAAGSGAAASPLAERRIALVDLLDRLLAGGVVLTGDLTLSIADVDLVRVDLRALISSVNENVPSPFEVR